MINLLPPEDTRQIRAGKTNVLLVKYNVFLLGALVFLLIALGIVYVYLNNSKTSSEKTIADNQAKVSSFQPVESEAQQFRTNLSIAKQILDREVSYTKAILEISKLLPAGTVLTGLSLDAATFGTQTTLVAQAKTYEAALTLKDSFQGSPFFSNVHFQSITTAEGTATPYPVTVNLNVTFKKGAFKS